MTKKKTKVKTDDIAIIIDKYDLYINYCSIDDAILKLEKVMNSWINNLKEIKNKYSDKENVSLSERNRPWEENPPDTQYSITYERDETDAEKVIREEKEEKAREKLEAEEKAELARLLKKY